MAPWTRLIRFVAQEDSQIYQGEPQLPAGVSGWSAFDIGNDYEGLEVKLITGDIYGANEVSSETRTVKKLLSPVSKEQITLVRCVGLNYLDHISEGQFAGGALKWPTQFIKGRSSLANPDEPVLVPKCAQDESMDLEAELTFIIGKTGKDISREKALEHVLGFTCGNDVSWRKAQLETPYSGTQWCYGKGLDNFAPIGPILVAPSQMDTSDLLIQSRLNGDSFQEARTKAMIFDVPAIIEHFSRGTTLEAGDVILSGTPQGIGYARKPRVYLKDGDKVEIQIEGIGTLRHSIEYE